ncbi:hypothetical protein JOB18_005809 [Solea senegalensis]|uniref:Uncharacterized protein n=1 Tax=Solea senegalensis TaxID=28829 RepID=A0AAV6QDM7_SOLSE|nr:hypothetical protein JOB18_005809 [Solea senegalensis]
MQATKRAYSSCNSTTESCVVLDDSAAAENSASSSPRSSFKEAPPLNQSIKFKITLVGVEPIKAQGARPKRWSGRAAANESSSWSDKEPHVNGRWSFELLNIHIHTELI